MKKRNILKRNSGFIVASILAAGTSFFAADTVLTELRPGSIQISNGNDDDIVIVESEKENTQETDTYETNPFTITSSGAVMDQVESETTLPEETELENESSSGNGSSGSNDMVIVEPDNSGNGNNNVSGSYENGIFSPDDLILWHINSRYIGEEELWNYDADTIRYIRNEIFALHGRIFESEDLRSYFGRKAWYVPTYTGDVFDPDMENYLNDYEWANLQLILAYEELLYE